MAFDWSNSRVLFNTLLLSFSFALSSCDSDSHVAEHDMDDRIQYQKPDSHLHDKNKGIFLFGFDLRSSPQEDARQYLPFLAYLEKATGYKFKLHFTPKHEDIADNVGKNHIQFAAVGAVSYLRANNQYGVVPVVRGINPYGKAKYRSYFVVVPESKIKSLTGIKGKHMAFGSRSSTQGHLIPRIELSKKDISLNDFSDYIYTGSHQNCANAVISRKADVCAMQDTMAKSMVNKKLLRVIHHSDYFPSSGIVASKDVPADVLKKVKQALLDFKPQGKDAKGLYNWYRTEMPLGFTNAEMGDYAELKEWAIKFNFIKKVENKAGK